MAMTNEHDALTDPASVAIHDGDARDFFALLKPRVMSLVVFTALGRNADGARPDPSCDRLPRDPGDRRRRWRIRRAQHVVRCRYRPDDGPHGEASDPCRRNFRRNHLAFGLFLSVFSVACWA
jgi:hypothetical protein